jgi:thymidylate synthase ThyX
LSKPLLLVTGLTAIWLTQDEGPNRRVCLSVWSSRTAVLGLFSLVRATVGNFNSHGFLHLSVAQRNQDVLVGTMIHIYDGQDFDPEILAMLQAFYSRSDLSIKDRVAKLLGEGEGTTQQQKIRDALSRYYIGYGHKSIGDMANTVLFIEDCSFLAAKAIQDNPLYCGQECSTRYMDFTNRQIILPANSPVGKAIVDEFMYLYHTAFSTLLANTPRSISDNPSGARAWAFDRARGLLPCGMTTRLSWSTNLRQAADNLQRLFGHELGEVRDIAHAMYTKLIRKYPNSFGQIAPHGAEYSPPLPTSGDFLTVEPNTVKRVNFHLPITRERKSLFPRYFEAFGLYEFRFILDYGSYRDIQRHRNLVNFPPLVCGQEFHSWYLDQVEPYLPGIRAQVNQLMADLFNLDIDPYSKQYYYPLGTVVQCQMAMGLPQAVYICELRSSRTVHPTLREIALNMAEVMLDKHPELVLYLDTGELTNERAKADIFKRT